MQDTRRKIYGVPQLGLELWLGSAAVIYGGVSHHLTRCTHTGGWLDSHCAARFAHDHLISFNFVSAQLQVQVHTQAWQCRWQNSPSLEVTCTYASACYHLRFPTDSYAPGIKAVDGGWDVCVLCIHRRLGRAVSVQCVRLTVIQCIHMYPYTCMVSMHLW